MTAKKLPSRSAANVTQSQSAPARPTVQSKHARPPLEDAHEVGQISKPSDFPLSAYCAPKKAKLVKGKFSKVRKVVVRVAAGSFVATVLVGGFLTWRGFAATGKVLSGTTTVAALSADEVSPTLLNGEGDGRVNILLLGIGGQGHDGGDLTDTMILASVDPVNNKVALLSIPRDLWVKMPVKYYGAYQKINAAYSAGKYNYLGKVDLRSTDKQAVAAGLDSVDTVVGQVLGVDIDYHAIVNFQAFSQAIDTVDGVTVDVDKPLVDASMAWENRNNATLVPAGQQHMDGKEALLYARSRHSTSDFDRSERQRKLILALKQKVLTLGTFSNPIKLDGLASAFGDNVYSDLSTQAALRLYDIVKDVKDADIQSLDLVTAPHSFVTTDVAGTASIVRPKLGIDNYSDIQTYVHSMLRDGYLADENATVYVAADTQERADATKVTLSGFGYNVVSAGTSVLAGPKTQVFDLTGGKAPYTRNYLEKRYGTTARTTLASGLIVPSGTQFVILVGK